MEQKRYSIDRVEHSVAVLVDEEENCSTVPLSELPEGAAEGDMLLWEDGVFRLDLDSTEQRRQKAIALQNLLRRRNK